MADQQVYMGVPAPIADLQQKGLIERAFHDGLFPQMKFRQEATFEEWDEHMGTEVVMTRPGLLKPKTKPQKPGTDPVPQNVPYEQWVAVIAQYADAIDTHTPTSATASQDIFLRNINQLGLAAGQSINRIARNAYFKAYLSGQTVLRVAATAGDSRIQVSSLNGFQDIVVPDKSARPQNVSPAYPLPITIIAGATKETASAIGAIPDSADDPEGPGTLILLATLANSYAIRASVKSLYAPRIVRPTQGESVDAIGPGDTLVAQQIINSVGLLRRANVQPHEDGYYHAHLAPMTQTQIMADPVFQRLNQSLPDNIVNKEGWLGTYQGVAFWMNNECPDETNVGDLTATTVIGGNTAQYAPEVGAEVVNGSGVKIGRTLITGKGMAYEKGLDEKAFLTEAGVNGKVGEFDIINNAVKVPTERVRLIIRAPQDRLQQFVSCAWSITTSFPIPSDQTAPSGSERFKRAIVLEHALG